MRYRDQNGQDWADIIDFLTMWPSARRRVGTAALADRARRDILILGPSKRCSPICG
jgi:hypothetical protein